VCVCVCVLCSKMYEVGVEVALCWLDLFYSSNELKFNVSSIASTHTLVHECLNPVIIIS